MATNGGMRQHGYRGGSVYDGRRAAGRARTALALIAWRNLLPRQQLAALDDRGERATKQRARLEAKL